MFSADIGSAAFGAACAALWGAGDFCGGLATKRTGVYAVVVGSQLCGVVALIVLAIVSHETIPPPVNLAGCGAAGVCGAVGLLALYRALAVGRMGMAAPISGVLSAAVPVVAGAMLQGVPGSLTLAGFALALAGVWLISYTDAGVFQPGVRQIELVFLLEKGVWRFVKQPHALVRSRKPGTSNTKQKN